MRGVGGRVVVEWDRGRSSGSLEVEEGARASAHRYSASALRPGQSPFMAVDWPSWPESDSGVETSMPAQKFFPAAQSTTTRTSSLSSIHRIARGISSHMEASMALDFRGRFRRTTPTCAARSTSRTTVSKLGGGTAIVATGPSRAPRCASEHPEEAPPGPGADFDRRPRRSVGARPSSAGDVPRRSPPAKCGPPTSARRTPPTRAHPSSRTPDTSNALLERISRPPDPSRAASRRPPRLSPRTTTGRISRAER